MVVAAHQRTGFAGKRAELISEQPESRYEPRVVGDGPAKPANEVSTDLRPKNRLGHQAAVPRRVPASPTASSSN